MSTRSVRCLTCEGADECLRPGNVVTPSEGKGFPGINALRRSVTTMQVVDCLGKVRRSGGVSASEKKF